LKNSKVAAKTSHYDVLGLSNRDSESEIKEAALPIDVEKIGLNSREIFSTLFSDIYYYIISSYIVSKKGKS